MSRVVGGHIREINKGIVHKAREVHAELVSHDRPAISTLPLRNHEEAFEALWPDEREKDRDVLKQLHDRYVEACVPLEPGIS